MSLRYWAIPFVAGFFIGGGITFLIVPRPQRSYLIVTYEVCEAFFDSEAGSPATQAAPKAAGLLGMLVRPAGPLSVEVYVPAGSFGIQDRVNEISQILRPSEGFQVHPVVCVQPGPTTATDRPWEVSPATAAKLSEHCGEQDLTVPAYQWVEAPTELAIPHRVVTADQGGQNQILVVAGQPYALQQQADSTHRDIWGFSVKQHANGLYLRLAMSDKAATRLVAVFAATGTWLAAIVSEGQVEYVAPAQLDKKNGLVLGPIKNATVVGIESWAGRSILIPALVKLPPLSVRLGTPGG